MAKKTLSMSLVVAMLATSNVPVWAAEFSDGSDAAVATEAPAVDAQATDVDTFTDDTDTAPVVDDTDAVDAQAIETNSENYAFTNVKAKKEAVDTDWKTAFGEDGASAAELFDKDSAIIDSKYGNETQANLLYVFRIGGNWDETTAKPITWTSSDEKLINSNIAIDDAGLRAAAGKTLELLFLEADKDGKLNVVNTLSYGTLKKADLNTVITASVGTKVEYNGLSQEVTPTIKTKLSGISTGDFKWTYLSTEKNYTDADVKVTVTGALTDSKVPDGYTNTVTTSYVISKRTLKATDIVVKLKNPGKSFEYQNNANTEIDKSEVDVFLKDFDPAKTDTVASGISLNDYVKKVTLDTRAVKDGVVVNVTFDSDALKASKNFNATAPTGVTSAKNKETATEDKNTKVKVVALDLSNCEVTLASPVKTTTTAKPTINPADVKILIKKDGKVLPLKTSDYTITVKTGDYSKADTYPEAITVAGNGKTVTGTKTLDLVTSADIFDSKCGFETKDWDKKLAKTKADAQKLSEALAYNNGKAVEFKKDVLGRFSPDGSSYGDQGNFDITYDNNINATTNESFAKLTVTAVAGSYKGCSQDFYFKIAPSNVNPTDTKTTTTVTTNVAKDAKGIALNEVNNDDATGYADAIGIKLNGINDTSLATTNKDAIISNATADDYTVKYSYVSGTDDKAGSNVVGHYVKAEFTFKKNGNFIVGNTSGTATALGDSTSSVKYKTVKSDSSNNGKVVVYVPITDKSIDTLDISLKKDTFTFTGDTIKPEVIVKENGKVLKDVVTIEGITDGINAGTATIKVSVKGYSGTKELKATINPAKLSDVVFEIKNKEDFTYNGKQQKPVIAQEDDTTTKDKDETITEAKATADVKLGKEIISKMFDITYGKNINAGEKAGSVTLTPKALYAKNFDGTSLTANFDILRAVLTGSSTSEVLSIKDTTGKKVAIEDDVYNGLNHAYVKYHDDNLDWTGDVAKFASVTVDEKKLSAAPVEAKFDDEDYELVYVNATDATTGNAPAYVAVVGKGNFKGEYSIVSENTITGVRNVYIELTEKAEKEAKENPGIYTILQKDVVEEAFVKYDIKGSEFGAKNITYSNGVYAGGTIVKPVVTVKDAKTGATLTEGTDYIISVNSRYYDTVNVSAIKIPFTIQGLGKYKDNIVYMKDGKQLTYSIDKKDLKDCSVSVDKNLKATVMNGNVLETKENFTVKDNGDGTATVSVVDGGKNYTGSVKVEIGGRKVGAPMISNVKVVGNKATVILSDDVEGASGYDYVISTDKDCITNKDYAAVNKNQAKTTTAFKYVDKGTYYAYCHAWTRDANGKKVFGEWSNGFQFSVTATTPDAPVITDVKVSGSTIKVTYRPAANATGYDVVLGTSSKKDNGELRPYNYGAHKKLNLKEGTVTATFKNVPKGTWTVGMHAFNRTSIDNKKVFSPWSNLETAKVK